MATEEFPSFDPFPDTSLKTEEDLMADLVGAFRSRQHPVIMEDDTISDQIKGDSDAFDSIHWDSNLDPGPDEESPEPVPVARKPATYTTVGKSKIY